MNKEIRKVKLISKNVLDSLSYYSRLNPLYYKNGEDINCPLQILYSMKITEQTRKLATGCSKHRFEVVDRTDEVSNHTYGKVKLTWFEEIFEEYKMILLLILYHMGRD